MRLLLLVSSVLVEVIRHRLFCMNHRNSGTLFLCFINVFALILDLMDEKFGMVVGGHCQ